MLSWACGLLAEGVTPTTSQNPPACTYGDRRSTAASPERVALKTISAPVEILREVQIVDTPRNERPRPRRHETLTQEFVPRSDLVLFVTSADRPFTESERAFMSSAFREWGKKTRLRWSTRSTFSVPRIG